MTLVTPTVSPSLTAEDLQRVFNVSPRTVTNWVRSKRIRCFRIGRVVRFAPEAVLELIATNSVNARRCGTLRGSETAFLLQVRNLFSVLPWQPVPSSDGSQFQPNRQDAKSAA